MRGQPLMPTTQHKGKQLLQEGKAHVVQRCPFTIQLKYATGETKQPIKLGIDIGYTKIGFRRQKYQLQPYILVKYNNRIYRVKGVHCYGTRAVLENPKGKNPSVGIKNLKLIKYGKGLLFALC
jgi:hypothetical protein